MMQTSTDLDFDARAELIAAARAAISSTDSKVELDCSAVDSVETIDDAVIGMLVTLARNARRRGARIVLVRASKSMRAQLQQAGVAHFFTDRASAHSDLRTRMRMIVATRETNNDPAQPTRFEKKRNMRRPGQFVAPVARAL